MNENSSAWCSSDHIDAVELVGFSTRVRQLSVIPRVAANETLTKLLLARAPERGTTYASSMRI